MITGYDETKRIYKMHISFQFSPYSHICSTGEFGNTQDNLLREGPSYRYMKQYSDEYYPASDENPPNNEHYIYVTYPPEIKRKLLDRYLARMTPEITTCINKRCCSFISY